MTCNYSTFFNILGTIYIMSIVKFSRFVQLSMCCVRKTLPFLISFRSIYFILGMNNNYYNMPVIQMVKIINKT